MASFVDLCDTSGGLLQGSSSALVFLTSILMIISGDYIPTKMIFIFIYLAFLAQYAFPVQFSSKSTYDDRMNLRIALFILSAATLVFNGIFNIYTGTPMGILKNTPLFLIPGLLALFIV